MAARAYRDRYDFSVFNSRGGPGMLVESWPREGGSAILVRKYEGESEDAMADAFHADAVELASQDYYPAGQHYVDGSWGCAATVVALVLCLFVIGLPIIGFMILNRPRGSLFVTYVFRPDEAALRG
jgi:hypothetical protein